MIREGYHADMVLLNPQTICDRATNEMPRQAPTGVEACWVNGVAALRAGKPTGALAGQVLTGR